jgi:hypothetical protein
MRTEEEMEEEGGRSQKVRVREFVRTAEGGRGAEERERSESALWERPVQRIPIIHQAK